MKKTILITLLVSSFSVYAMQEKKEKQEISTVAEAMVDKSSLISRINAYRSKCLEEHLPKVLSTLVQEYDPIEDKWECEKALMGHKGFITALCVLPNNKLASGSFDTTIKIWDLDSGQCEMTLNDTNYNNKFEIFDRKLRIASLCLLSDNKLVSGCESGIIKIWDLTSGKCEKTIENYGGVIDLCILPGNKLAVASDRSDTIEILDLTSGRCEKTLKDYRIGFTSLCLLPKNKLASGSVHGKIKIWDLESGVCESELIGHQERVSQLLLMSENQLVSGSWYKKNAIKIWDLKSGKLKESLDGNNINNLCVLPGNKLAAGSYSKPLKIWDLASKKCESILNDNQFYSSICLLPGNKLAASFIDGTIKILNNPFVACEEFDKFIYKK